MYYPFPPHAQNTMLIHSNSMPTTNHISGTHNDAHNLPAPPNTSWGPRMMPTMSLAHKAQGLSIQDHQLHLWGPMSTPTVSPASNHKLNTSPTTLLPPPHPMTMPTAPPHLNAKETYPRQLHHHKAEHGNPRPHP